MAIAAPGVTGHGCKGKRADAGSRAGSVRSQPQAHIAIKNDVGAGIGLFDPLEGRRHRTGEVEGHAVPGEGETIEDPGSKHRERGVAAADPGIPHRLRKAAGEEGEEKEEKDDAPVDGGDEQGAPGGFSHRGGFYQGGLKDSTWQGMTYAAR